MVNDGVLQDGFHSITKQSVGSFTGVGLSVGIDEEKGIWFNAEITSENYNSTYLTIAFDRAVDVTDYNYLSAKLTVQVNTGNGVVLQVGLSDTASGTSNIFTTYKQVTNINKTDYSVNTIYLDLDISQITGKKFIKILFKIKGGVGYVTTPTIALEK